MLPVVEQLRKLCAVAVTALPASGAGLSVYSADGGHSLLAAADATSERIEELQFVLGEGPCVDAAAARRPVLVADLDDESPGRWPIYTPAVRALGVHACYAFPLQVGAATLGVIDFFRVRPGPLTGPELSRAFDLADNATSILLHGPDSDGSLIGSADLFQAQGMVMVQAGTSLAAAMDLIRAYAFANDWRLDDVARAVVSRKLRFDDE